MRLPPALQAQILAAAGVSPVHPGTPEAEFQDAVVGEARRVGWRVAHFRRVRVQRADGATYWETPVAADGKGFPDLVLVRAGRVLWLELKSAAGRLGAEQVAWGNLLRAAGQEYRVFRPGDWAEVVETLAAGAAPAGMPALGNG